MIWTDLSNLIAESNSFLICSHVSHDADNIGSQLSFYWYLKSLGKDVEIFNVDVVPRKFNFYTNIDQVSNTEPNRRFDVFVLLDSSNLSRSGWDKAATIADKIIDIDHHRDNNLFGTVSCVDTTAAATCQIVYRFFKENNIDFPEYVAEALYGGILADTGGFQFDNTSPEIFEIAADLSRRGVSTAKVYKKLYASNSIAGLTVRSIVWSTLKFYENNRVGIMVLEEGLLEKYGADRGDLEGMSDMAMTAEGVEVGIFAKPIGNEIRFSLRSVGTVDVGMIAASFSGGGGHKAASGCTSVDLSLEQAVDALLTLIRAELK